MYPIVSLLCKITPQLMAHTSNVFIKYRNICFQPPKYGQQLISKWCPKYAHQHFEIIDGPWVLLPLAVCRVVPVCEPQACRVIGFSVVVLGVLMWWRLVAVAAAQYFVGNSNGGGLPDQQLVERVPSKQPHPCSSQVPKRTHNAR